MIRLWNGLTFDSMMFFAALMESVIMMMLWVSLLSITEIKPKWIAISLALIGVTFIV